jgi:hypothetical protein
MKGVFRNGQHYPRAEFGDYLVINDDHSVYGQGAIFHATEWHFGYEGIVFKGTVVGRSGGVEPALASLWRLRPVRNDMWRPDNL